MVKTESDKVVEQTVAAKLWEKIKDLPMDIFALPNQTVGNHAKREEGMDNIFPNDIYLTLRSAAAYPALEEALGTSQARTQTKLVKGERFELSQSAKYTVIKVIKS